MFSGIHVWFPGFSGSTVGTGGLAVVTWLQTYSQPYLQSAPSPKQLAVLDSK